MKWHVIKAVHWILPRQANSEKLARSVIHDLVLDYEQTDVRNERNNKFETFHREPFAETCPRRDMVLIYAFISQRFMGKVLFYSLAQRFSSLQDNYNKEWGGTRPL